MRQLEKYIDKINVAVKRVLKNRYIGLYIHGSVAEGAFKWERSDIDILVMMKGQLISDEKRELLKICRALKAEGTEKGIEMSVLSKELIEINSHPFPYEFHYSEYWYESVMSEGWEHLDSNLAVDEDLSSHIFNLHQNHIVVEGPPVKEVFPDISKSDFLKSIEYDQLDAAVTSVDTVMNLCRLDYFLSTGRLVSKSEGLYYVLNHTKIYNEFLEVVKHLYDNNKRYLPSEYGQEASDFRYTMNKKREL